MIIKEIIKISETKTGLQTILATDLHNFLAPKTPFNKWIKRMIEFGFIEHIDFWTFLSKSIGGRKKTEYVLSLDCAKSISMIQRTELGQRIRTYFIEAEKEFRKIATPEQIESLYSKIKILESNQVDFTNDWTVDRFLRTNGLTESSSNVFKQQLGKKCTKYLKQKTGNTPKKVQHPSYLNGQNVYPYELINQVYSEITKK